jgi:hypothetical protein
MKTTKKTTRNAQARKLAMKVKGAAKASERLPRAGRSAGTATTETSDATQTNLSRQKSKKAMIEALVRRKAGAAIADLMTATGWREHSVRAALTGLRKVGHAISRERDDRGATRYRIAGAA